MASGVGTKSRAPASTSSISLGICWVISREDNRRGVAPAFVRPSNMGSVNTFVSVSRSGAGIDTIDGDRSDSIPGIGAVSD